MGETALLSRERCPPYPYGAFLRKRHAIAWIIIIFNIVIPVEIKGSGATK
jgi:hypothetical protein